MNWLKKEVSFIMIIPVLILLVLILTPSAIAVHYCKLYKTALLASEEAKRELAVFMQAQQFRDERNNPVEDLQVADTNTYYGKGGWDILSESPVITHAMGEYGEYNYLNCLEGFLNAYKNGSRVFEADFCLTSDCYVVLRHDWGLERQEGIDSTRIPTRNQFLSTPILGKYTPLSFADLVKMMLEYKDICIITDTKFAQPEIADIMFHSMLKEAKMLSQEDIFNRIIVQVYSRDMLEALQYHYDFPYYIYTLYQEDFNSSDEEFLSIAEFCDEKNIQGITMPVDWWKDSFSSIAEEHGLLCFVHPVNDKEIARSLLDRGISGIYSWKLVPSDLRN